MSRERLINELRNKHRAQSDRELMNCLQEAGLVSDNAESIQQVCNADLVKAYNKEMSHGSAANTKQT